MPDRAESVAAAAVGPADFDAAAAAGAVDAAAAAAAVADTHRHGWAQVLAATIRVTHDIELAEECVQDAYARALTAWEAAIPANPVAWLITTARRRALDELRRASVLRGKLPLLVEAEPQPDAETFPDDRLRLVFTCCHPALALEAQVALTLRLLCGLTTQEVARAFLVPDATMAARITRAKKKIAAAGVPYRIPHPGELPERITGVLTVVHLLFTAGHSAPAGPTLTRPDLTERALDLARMLRLLLPDNADVTGLLALILITDARRATRTGSEGELLRLDEQDRTRWDRTAIAEGVALLREALAHKPPGRFTLQAAIAAVHAEAPRYTDTDWVEILVLYDLLREQWPSPVVALNRAVALGMAAGPAAGLEALDELLDEPQLAHYPYLAASRAEFLSRLGRGDEARLAYEEALLLTENAVERRFLESRLDAMTGTS